MRVPDKRDLGDKSAHRDLILLFHEMSQFMRENKEHSHSANMRGGRTQCMLAWLAKLAKIGYLKFAQIPTVGRRTAQKSTFCVMFILILEERTKITESQC
jgi:hypothetical protein